MSTSPGRIIFLNGTSSSGKSSIAHELARILDDTHFVMAVDAFNAMRARREFAPAELEGVLSRTRAGFHRSVAGMSQAGNNVIVDHVLSEPWRLRDCVELFVGLDVVFVGVRCDLEELERREGERGDRPRGLARQQFEQVHAHGIYDVECDTGVTSAAGCARRIKEFLSEPASERAFDRLRRTSST